MLLEQSATGSLTEDDVIRLIRSGVDGIVRGTNQWSLYNKAQLVASVEDIAKRAKVRSQEIGRASCRERV